MPVRIKCQCGKVLSIKDELRGKQVKCPGCSKVLRVPAANPGPAKAAVAAAGGQSGPGAKSRLQSAAGGASDSLDDLFAEEGFNRQVAAVCPACRSEMAAGAVLCTKCGFNKQTGQRLDGHKTPGVDIGMGTLALMKAETDMRADKDIQDRMLSRSGMPWWMLGLVLFIMVGGVGILTMAVNASKQLDGGGSINVMGTFLVLSGGGFYLVAFGAALVILVKAFQKSLLEGLLYILVPFYAIYFWFKYWREVWRPLLLSMIAGGIAAGLLIAGLGSLQGG